MRESKHCGLRHVKHTVYVNLSRVNRSVQDPIHRSALFPVWPQIAPMPTTNVFASKVSLLLKPVCPAVVHQVCPQLYPSDLKFAVLFRHSRD